MVLPTISPLRVSDYGPPARLPGCQVARLPGCQLSEVAIDACAGLVQLDVRQ